MRTHCDDRRTFEDEVHRLLQLDRAVREYLSSISDFGALCASAAKWRRELERLTA